MEYFEVQINEQKNFPKGYGRMYGESEEFVWDTIMQEMSKRPHQKYLKHLKFEKWEPDGGIYYYPPANKIEESSGNGWTEFRVTEKGSGIPTGTLKIFLKIYVEDR